MQEHDLVGAGRANGRNGGLDLVQVRETRREDHRTPAPRDLLEQRQVRQIRRRDLERRDAEAVEQVDARDVERRREEREPALLRARLELGERVAIELEPAQHLELRLVAVGRLELVAGLRRAGGREPLGAEGLELDAVGAGGRGGVDERERDVDRRCG